VLVYGSVNTTTPYLAHRWSTIINKSNIGLVHQNTYLIQPNDEPNMKYVVWHQNENHLQVTS